MTRFLTAAAAIGILVAAPALLGTVRGQQDPFGVPEQGARVPGIPSEADASQASTGDTARLTGQVVAGDTGRPLGRATVSLLAMDSEVPVSRAATGNDGRYELTGVPAGRYRLRAGGGGYAAVEYGQRRPFESGRPLDLRAGEHLDDVDVTLPRGSVIAVRVTDDLGDPLAGVLLQVHRYQWMSDGRLALSGIQAGAAGINATDDRGEARVFALMPGRYVISARTTIDGMGAAPDPSALTPGEGSIAGFAPTFHPGTVNPAEAVEVAVGAGQEVAVQFPMVPARLVTVAGTAVDSSGRPAAGANVSLLTATVDGGTTGRPAASVSASGRFSISGVFPGDHFLNVTYSSRGEFAIVAVAVPGDDLADIRVVTSTGTTVRGRVVLDGTSSAAAPGVVAMVRLSSADGSPMTNYGPPAFPDSGRWSLADDEGSFEIPGAISRVLFDVQTRQGWQMTSVRLNGRDITDEPVDLAGVNVLSGVVITVTDELTTITGRVVDGRGRPVADCVVVVQPAEDLEPVAAARRVRALRPDQQGRFETRGMRPGRYVATALESLEDGRQFDPEFREQLRRRGETFELRDGGTATPTLTLASGL